MGLNPRVLVPSNDDGLFILIEEEDCGVGRGFLK